MRNLEKRLLVDQQSSTIECRCSGRQLLIPLKFMLADLGPGRLGACRRSFLTVDLHLRVACRPRPSRTAATGLVRGDLDVVDSLKLRHA